jgi:hypothetical protein
MLEMTSSAFLLFNQPFSVPAAFLAKAQSAAAAQQQQ